ncbi:alpha-N-acetylglucosaminidase N-terminal domain-containing protein [Bacteroides ovatus]|nr:alpha-N-acetylglucosaminidase N-terminal domain-containing protein [Bacteroides ovatus]
MIKLKSRGITIIHWQQGLNHYLKYYCHTHVSWYATDKIEMPRQLPVLLDKITVLAKECKTRFF